MTTFPELCEIKRVLLALRDYSAAKRERLTEPLRLLRLKLFKEVKSCREDYRWYIAVAENILNVTTLMYMYAHRLKIINQ